MWLILFVIAIYLIFNFDWSVRGGKASYYSDNDILEFDHFLESIKNPLPIENNSVGKKIPYYPIPQAMAITQQRKKYEEPSKKRFNKNDANKFMGMNYDVWKKSGQTKKPNKRKALLLRSLNMAKGQPENDDVCHDVLTLAIEDGFFDLAAESLLAVDKKTEGYTYCRMVYGLYNEMHCWPFITETITQTALSRLLAYQKDPEVFNGAYDGPGMALSCLGRYLFLQGQTGRAFRVLNAVKISEAVDNELTLICTEIARATPDQTSFAIDLSTYIANRVERAHAIASIARQQPDMDTEEWRNNDRDEKQSLNEEDWLNRNKLEKRFSLPGVFKMDRECKVEVTMIRKEPLDEAEEEKPNDKQLENDLAESEISKATNSDDNKAISTAKYLSKGPPEAPTPLEDIPDRPGLYAIYIADKSVLPEEMQDHVDAKKPLYIGKAKTSLRDRELGQHFKAGRSGSSTVRRTWISLLRKKLILNPIPRGKGKTDLDFRNYRCDVSGEKRLSEWMKQHLRLRWLVLSNTHDLAGLETTVIEQCNPPLNLTHSGHPFTQTVKALRKECVDLALQKKDDG